MDSFSIVFHRDSYQEFLGRYFLSSSTGTYVREIETVLYIPPLSFSCVLLSLLPPMSAPHSVCRRETPSTSSSSFSSFSEGGFFPAMSVPNDAPHHPFAPLHDAPFSSLFLELHPLPPPLPWRYIASPSSFPPSLSSPHFSPWRLPHSLSLGDGEEASSAHCHRHEEGGREALAFPVSSAPSSRSRRRRRRWRRGRPVAPPKGRTRGRRVGRREREAYGGEGTYELRPCAASSSKERILLLLLLGGGVVGPQSGSARGHRERRRET
jgi:hypothetical protein